jgi:hypothetical protein
VLVRWRAVDGDGQPLTAKVDYSTNGGGRWREIFSGPNHDRVTLPASLFAGSRRARLRIRVNDGFDEGVAVSAIFTAAGRPPDVRILSPAAGQHVLGDAELYLEGSAYDDAGRRLRGRQLQWFAGALRLGSGATLSVTALAAGTRAIRLVARDARGRRASATVRLRVTAAAPHILSLRVAPWLGPKATRLVLRLATTVPAQLTAAGHRFHLDRRPRRIVLPVRTGTKPLRLHLRLAAGGQSTAATLVLRRR